MLLYEVVRITPYIMNHHVERRKINGFGRRAGLAKAKSTGESLGG